MKEFGIPYRLGPKKGTGDGEFLFIETEIRTNQADSLGRKSLNMELKNRHNYSFLVFQSVAYEVK